MRKIEQVRATDWQRWTTDNQAVVLDVREPHEWSTGTLPGAVRMNLGSLPGRIRELDASRPVLVVCHSGNRSSAAAKYLSKSGFRAANLAGGMIALQRVG